MPLPAGPGPIPFADTESWAMAPLLRAIPLSRCPNRRVKSRTGMSGDRALARRPRYLLPVQGGEFHFSLAVWQKDCHTPDKRRPLCTFAQG